MVRADNWLLKKRRARYNQHINLTFQTMAEAKKKQELNIQIDKDNQSGVYANAVSVHVNRNEVVVDMGYLVPNVKPTTIKIVSRVNLNHRTAESFVSILQNALLDYRNKQEEKKK